jgi:hypothetical protein
VAEELGEGSRLPLEGFPVQGIHIIDMEGVAKRRYRHYDQTATGGGRKGRDRDLELHFAVEDVQRPSGDLNKGALLRSDFLQNVVGLGVGSWGAMLL